MEDLMGKTSTTSKSKTRNALIDSVRSALSILTVFLIVINSQAVNAQCSLACNGLTQISLDQNCQARITPSMILNDTMTLCPGAQYEVKVLKYKIPIPTGDVVTGLYVGQTLQVEIKDKISGNKCWGDIKIEDKLAPVIECGRDTIPCFAASKFVPTATDGCGLDTVLLVDELIQPLNCNPSFIKQIVRRYIARDIYGNTSPMCYDTILLKRFDTAKVICPKNWVYDPIHPLLNCPIACKDINYNRIPLDRNGHPHPDYTGVPQYRDTVSKAPVDVDTIKLWPVQDIYCNIGVTYEDIDLGIIGCVHKYMRAWTIREWWCNTEIVRSCPQLIEIVDREAPYVHAPYDFTTTTDGGYKCEATVTIPPAIVFDSCRSAIKVDVVYPGGILKNQNGGTVKLPVGRDTIIYRAYDACYNESSDTMIITVEDHTAPVAICDRETVVSLSIDPITHVYATTFDDGSYDDCHIDSMLVRRMDESPCDADILPEVFKPFVEFCCDDVGKRITVVFRVKDKHGNANDCMVQVEVQDKIKPRCTSPTNLTVACDYHFDLNDLTVFGEIQTDSAYLNNVRTIRYKGYDWTKDSVLHFHDGWAYDNCDFTIRKYYEDKRTQCNVGDIIRYWIVADRNGVDTCKQTITFFNYHPFRWDSIVWPKDTTLTMCFDPASLTPDRMGRPSAHDEDKCDLLGYSYKDDLFRIVNGGDACYKILRTWKALDWCQFNYNTVTHNYEYATATHVQVIKVNNLVDPVITARLTDTTFCTYDSCTSGPVVLTATATDDCTPTNELIWEYLVDLDRNGTYDIIRSGVGGSIDASGRYKLGNHRIKYVFEDKCGNKVARERNFTVMNCKAPTPYCINGVAIDLMPMDLDGNGTVDTAMITVWASDVDQGSYHSCGNRITLSFSSDTTVKSLTFTCPAAQHNVDLWVTDVVTGIQSFCRTFIDVQDNNKACEDNLGNGTVSGLITTSGGTRTGVNSVEVELEGSNVAGTKTSANGQYAFTNMPYGKSTYTVVPAKDNDYLNGVSTADIVKIQKHILGISYLEDPYKIIAADVNNNKTITSSDISELRKLILGITTQFKNNGSWAFIDASYKFTTDMTSAYRDEVLKEPYPRNYIISPFEKSMVINFNGVKIGDLNETVNANLFNTASGRTREQLNLIVDDVKYNKGDLIEIPVNCEKTENLSGYQFTIQIDPTKVEFVDMIAGVCNLNKDNLGLTQMDNGFITVSWNAFESVQVKSSDKLFTIVLKALSTSTLSQSIHMNSAITTAEAYDQNLIEKDIRLSFRSDNGIISDNGIVLYQNNPNPFSDNTVIGFEVPKAAKATLSIYDLTGKVLFVKEVNTVKGYNSVRVNNSQLGVTGILFYQLDAEGYSATRRMLVIQ